MGWYATHLSRPYTYALEHPLALDLEHAFLIAIGICFWWPVIVPSARRMGSGVRAVRLPLKVAEHPFGLAALRAQRADVLHFQWLVPEVDVRLFRPHAPSVFTAHDLLPRRTARKQRLWQRLLGRFDRVVVHSERGRETLADLGVNTLQVIPHPVFRQRPGAQSTTAGPCSRSA